MPEKSSDSSRTSNNHYQSGGKRDDDANEIARNLLGFKNAKNWGDGNSSVRASSTVGRDKEASNDSSRHSSNANISAARPLLTGITTIGNNYQGMTSGGHPAQQGGGHLHCIAPVITHFEPKFIEIFQAYCKQTNGKIYDVSAPLMSLCLDHLLALCCWVRESNDRCNWIRNILDDNVDLRPEVRNGLAMVHVYAFAAAKATLWGKKGSDMFIVLQDPENGFGIVNKTSLKIYNDPFNYFGFIKLCISGLIDCGKLPENERQNQPKKPKRLLLNREELAAFLQLKSQLVSLLNSGDSNTVKLKVEQIMLAWQYRPKEVRTRRFAIAVGVLSNQLSPSGTANMVIPPSLMASLNVLPSGASATNMFGLSTGAGGEMGGETHSSASLSSALSSLSSTGIPQPPLQLLQMSPSTVQLALGPSGLQVTSSINSNGAGSSTATAYLSSLAATVSGSTTAAPALAPSGVGFLSSSGGNNTSSSSVASILESRGVSAAGSGGASAFTSSRPPLRAAPSSSSCSGGAAAAPGTSSATTTVGGGGGGNRSADNNDLNRKRSQPSFTAQSSSGHDSSNFILKKMRGGEEPVNQSTTTSSALSSSSSSSGANSSSRKPQDYALNYQGAPSSSGHIDQHRPHQQGGRVMPSSSGGGGENDSSVSLAGASTASTNNGTKNKQSQEETFRQPSTNLGCFQRPPSSQSQVDPRTAIGSVSGGRSGSSSFYNKEDGYETANNSSSGEDESGRDPDSPILLTSQTKAGLRIPLNSTSAAPGGRGSLGGAPLSERPQRVIKALRFERIGLKQWDVKETRLFNIDTLLANNSATICLIDESHLSTEEMKDGRLKSSSGGLVTLQSELANRHALITTWPKREYAQLADLVTNWQNPAGQSRTTGSSDSVSLIRYWHNLAPDHHSSHHFDQNALYSSSDTNGGGGALAYEVNMQVGIILRSCTAAGVSEDCWRMIYPSDLQEELYSASFASFLSSFFPQLRSPFSQLKDLRSVVVKYYPHQVQLPLVQPPAKLDPVSYQTLGTLDESADDVLKRLEPGVAVHDFILHNLSFAPTK